MNTTMPPSPPLSPQSPQQPAPSQPQPPSPTDSTTSAHSTPGSNSSSSLPPLFVRPPAKYLSSIARNASPPPPTAEWLTRTWSVAYSTLAMWRSARNVRITYSGLPSKNDRTRLNDTVEYESNKPNASPIVKSVAGIDTISREDGASWTWRGRGLLFFVTSHWEILAWGENELPNGNGETECWVVTWFAPTVFTQEGIDIYSSRPEGLGEATYDHIISGLKRMEAKHVSKLVTEHMAPVEIKLPWSNNGV